MGRGPSRPRPGLPSPTEVGAVQRRGIALPPAQRLRVPRWVVLVLALLAATALVRAFGSSALEGYRLRREAIRLEQAVRRLRQENAQLREEIRRLHSPKHIEQLAREQLGLVRPGEISIMVVRPSPTPTARKP